MAAPTSTIRVHIIAAWPDRVERIDIELPAGATLRDALLAASGNTAGEPCEDAADVGLWGKQVPLDTVLANGDRIERYRPITADPKQARHRRATEQGYRWQGRTRRAARGGKSAG